MSKVFLKVRVIYDAAKHNKIIKQSIKKYGYLPEHNFFHYIHSESSDSKNIFFDYGKTRGVLAQYHQKTNAWSIFPCGILARKPEITSLLLHAAIFILGKRKAKKLTVEVEEKTRKELLKKLKKQNELRACSCNYVLYWPVYNMKLWDPKLKGSKMKKLRNIRNRLYKKNRIRVKNSKDVPKEKLNDVLSAWLKSRNIPERVDKSYYINVINDRFNGFDIAKTAYINGKPSTITAGWKIPNSNSYYSAIGIADRSCHGLGEMANIDDLNRLKRKGFDYADFGGSGSALLRFKKKFNPERIYKTYIFSIVRR